MARKSSAGMQQASPSKTSLNGNVRVLSEKDTEEETINIVSNGASPSSLVDNNDKTAEANSEAPPSATGESDPPSANGTRRRRGRSCDEEVVDAILEGIVTKDGHVDSSLKDDERASRHNRRAGSLRNSSHQSPASKSLISAKMASAKGSGDEEDDRKPAAINGKKTRLEEFQCGRPKKHNIKASKMVHLKIAQASSNATPEDAIVLSSDDDDDDEDSPKDSGRKNGQDDTGTPIQGILQRKEASGTPAKTPTSRALAYQEDERKKVPPVAKAPTGPMARDLEVGERVYCEFSFNKRYYWGNIVKRFKRKSSHVFKYDVRFDDGDEELDVSSKKMVTVTEFILQFGEKEYHKSLEQSANGSFESMHVPALQHVHTSQSRLDGNFSMINTQGLHEQPCSRCENCIKPRCGSCNLCKGRGAGGENLRCYQKMCCKIPEEKKLQTYVGLPEGTGFCFKERETNPQYEGLCLMSKGGRKFKAFETCFIKSSPDAKAIEAFYSFVGLLDRYKGGGPVSSEGNEGLDQPEERISRTKATLRPLTPHELWVERCQKCQNCIRPECLKCICCRGNTRDPTARNVCYQKMCLGIDLARRAQPTPANFGNFPPGWKFAFDVTRPDLPHLQGLILIPPPPNTRKYASVERAVNHNNVLLANVDQMLFYSCVGLPHDVPERKLTEANSGGTAGQAKRPASLGAGKRTGKKARGVTVDIQMGLSPRELHERRCKNCSMCVKPSCNQCRSCKGNASQTRTFKDVCFQKMCCEIKEGDKVQPATGFPEGWRFYYTDPAKLSWRSSGEHTGLAGLVLLSPTGRRFNSVESAAIVLDADEVPTIARTFYGDVGCHATVAVKDHVLLGKPFRQKWVDVEGKTKMVYGKIVEVAEDLLSGGIRTCTIEFSQKSRSLLNAGFAPNGAMIPEKQKVPQSIAFGGCLDCDSRAVRYDMVPYHLSWNIPDVRHEDFVVDEHGMYAPRLTMHFRGFHLVFTAKTSTIPNSGKGVFVSCTSLTGSSDDVFELGAGELLDLGVYAPFRRADRKSAHIFLMKNFIHSYQCEEWNFDTVMDDNLFDITDDATGKLHELASRHLPAYVNETDGHSTASVFAQHDPEGCVHYLLGHGSEGDGPLTLLADGNEQEIFIDYGETYEDVRVRKNYSRLSQEEAAERLRGLDLDYKEVFEELKTYNATEIVQCVNFMMKDIFYPNRSYPVSVILRALLVAVLFRKLAESFVNDFSILTANEEEENMSVCHNGFSRDGMDVVIRQSTNLIKTLFQYCNSWHQIKETILSDEMYLTSLQYVLGEADYASMSPEELGVLIVGQQPYLNLTAV